jgi:hypothetical protein
MPISGQDRAEIIDLLARYTWLVDEGEGEAWADLWTEDGSFTGIPEPLHGREALQGMPRGFHQGFGGRLRHHITNVLLSPGATSDEARVKAYSTVSDWRDGGKLLGFAKINLTLLRQAGAWKIKALRAEML